MPPRRAKFHWPGMRGGKIMQEPKTGLRANSTDRDAMLAAFARHFGNLSKKELGQLFDKYRLMGRLDVRWNDRTGEYVVSIFE